MLHNIIRHLIVFTSSLNLYCYMCMLKIKVHDLKQHAGLINDVAFAARRGVNGSGNRLAVSIRVDGAWRLCF